MQTIPAGSLARFGEYVADLRTLLRANAADSKDSRLIAALDGQPTLKVREFVGIAALRRTGTFFTGTKLAKRVLKGAGFLGHGLCFDPACGTGDLLLAVADTLPLQQTFEETMEAWGEILAGCDVHKEFVNAAKIRICLLGIKRGLPLPEKRLDLRTILPNIIQADGMRHEAVSPPQNIVMNPPYSWVTAPSECSWCEGSVSSAALFVDRWLDLVARGGRLIAILPDVLRTGSNYRAWRESMLKRAAVEKLSVVGRFDPGVDVDVFSACFLRQDTTRMISNSWKWYKNKARSTVGDHFEISVGNIVPHRDPKEGFVRAFLHARGAPRWEEIRRIADRIPTSRAIFKPPFVVIRRTSSPSDSARAIGTLVSGIRGVAVENHLFVLTPRQGTKKECHELLRVLKSPSTSVWLNQRIRCRHLTVDAVKNIPWRVG